MKNQTELPDETLYDYLQEPTRTETFQAWMDSLEDRNIRRAGGDVYDGRKFGKNWSTSRR